MIRRLLFLLVCLGLVLQAPAVRALDESPCPMEATMQATLAAGELDPADLPDCCNDAQTFAATGQLCKPGTDCGSAPTTTTIGPRAAPAADAPTAAAALPRAGPAPALAAPIAPPWRPPAQR